VKRLEELIGVAVALVSVGPEREQAIIVKPIL
jgi:adenylosuccinate synthase